MSLAPKWAKTAAVMGLKAQILQLRISAALLPESAPLPFIKSAIDDYEAEVERIAAMKD